MPVRTLLVGFDAPDARLLADRLGGESVAHEMLPKIVVAGGRLLAPGATSARLLTVDRVVFHGIFEHDLSFLAGLALWGGPCFPAPGPMLDCRLRLTGLVKALAVTRFGGPRDFLFTGAEYDAGGTERVAKWGDWHCGEGKERFSGVWRAAGPTLVEPFVPGEAVRVAVIGGRPPRQMRLGGAGWRKSVHGSGAAVTAVDPELAADTLALKTALKLDLIATDYVLGPAGPYLLEVNHIPSVAGFPELWREYVDAVAAWAGV